jgi:hypothetical protein
MKEINMPNDVSEVMEKVKSLTSAERDELFEGILRDADLREDLLDLALVLQAEAEGGETVMLNELAAGKRTYRAG